MQNFGPLSGSLCWPGCNTNTGQPPSDSAANAAGQVESSCSLVIALVASAKHLW